MKQLFTLMLICACCAAAAQDGRIYRSSDDLLSDRYEAVPDLRMKPPADDVLFGNAGYRPVSKLKTKKELKQETAFVLFRDTLYVNLGALDDTAKRSAPYCVPAERLDRYVFFRFFSRDQMIKISTYSFMFGIAGGGIAYDRQKKQMPYFCLDLTTGKSQPLGEQYMPELLKGYPDLLGDYLRETEPGRQETINGYIDRYRQYKLTGKPETPGLEIDGRTGSGSLPIPGEFDVTVLYASASDYLNGWYEIVAGVRLACPNSMRAGRETTEIRIPSCSHAALVNKLNSKTFIIQTGDSLYINCRKFPTASKGYAPAERFGDFVFCRLRPNISAVLPEEANGTQDDGTSGPIRKNDLYWFYTNLHTGEPRILDSGCLYALLDEYPDLLERYMAETQPNDKRTLESYLDAYRKRKTHGD